MIMASDTLRQIENINKSLRWVKAHRPDVYEQRFLQLVEERRKLRKIAKAAEDNPNISAHLIHIDSVGGEAYGCHEVFNVIKDGTRYCLTVSGE